MSTVLRSARGASAFTQDDSSRSRGRAPTAPLAAGASVWSRAADDPRQAWSQVIDELLRMRLLKDDWDGEGALAPHPSLVDGAISLARDLQANGTPAADRVLASPNGTICFEWFTPLGYQEIEVISPVEAKFCWVPKGADEAMIVNFSGSP